MDIFIILVDSYEQPNDWGYGNHMIASFQLHVDEVTQTCVGKIVRCLLKKYTRRREPLASF